MKLFRRRSEPVHPDVLSAEAIEDLKSDLLGAWDLLTTDDDRLWPKRKIQALVESALHRLPWDPDDPALLFLDNFGAGGPHDHKGDTSG